MVTRGEDIIITARFVDKITKGIKTTRTTINQFGQTVKTVTKQHKRMEDGTKKLVKQTIKSNKVVQSATITQKGFSGVMSMSLVQWRQFNALGGKFNTMGGKMGNRLRLLTHGMRGFRMEMLGVMFFGMGISKFMGGLLQPAAKATGIFELFGSLLEVLFLPIMMALMPWLLKLIDFFMNLSNPAKLAVGVFVIFWKIVGVIVFLIGMFALGIGSVILAMLGWAIIIGALIAGIIAFIVYIIAMRKEGKSWGEIFMGIFGKVWKFIKAVFTPVWIFLGKVIKGIFAKLIIKAKEWKDKMIMRFREFKDKIIAWFKEKIPEKIAKAWDIVKDKTIEKWEAIVAKIKELWNEFIGWIKSKIPEPIKKIGAFIKSKLPGAQVGGVIPHTGLRMLHAGERVIPAGDTFTSAPTINVYASAGMDVGDLARQVSEIISRDLTILARR